jgi:dolichyl-phosphate-mannose--protein O-mannosyl transferase
VVAVLGQYLPWFLVSRPTFFFYVLPIVFAAIIVYLYKELLQGRTVKKIFVARQKLVNIVV